MAPSTHTHTHIQTHTHTHTHTHIYIYWACFHYSIQSVSRLDVYSKAPWVKCMNMWSALFLKLVQSFNFVQLSCWNSTYSADFWEWEVKRCCYIHQNKFKTVFQHFRDFSFSFFCFFNNKQLAVVNATILEPRDFSGNEKPIFLTASWDISICVCGDKTGYFKAKLYLFLSLTTDMKRFNTSEVCRNIYGQHLFV